MRKVFLLVVVLIAVIAAMFVLKRKSEQVRPAAGAPAAAGGVSDGGTGGMRVVALTRLIPRYAVALPAAEPVELRAKVLEHLLKHGGRATAALPSDPRAPFAAQVPHAAFKKLLRDLGLGARPVMVTARGEVPHTSGPAVVILEISLPAPQATVKPKD